MVEHAESPAESPRSSPALDQSLAKLKALVRVIDDDARRMDANLAAAHSLVEEAWRAVFGRAGVLDPSKYVDTYRELKARREAENDIHEVYADGLERLEKRQRQNLGVAESDSDKHALVKRRRDYISKLTAFMDEVSEIHNYLGG